MDVDTLQHTCTVPLNEFFLFFGFWRDFLVESWITKFDLTLFEILPKKHKSVIACRLWLKLDSVVEQIKLISKWFLSNFLNICHLLNQSNCKFLNRMEQIIIKSNFCWFDSNLQLGSSRTNRIWINFHRIFWTFFAF